MPLRIYDVSMKKLGLENKDIISKAKALGIAAAKVPSTAVSIGSSAEWLEEELLLRIILKLSLGSHPSQ